MEKLVNKNTITSIELVEQINIFRKQEGKKTELQHKDLLKIIRDEFEDEIGEGKFSPTSYKDRWNREQPMYILTLNQGKQVLVRESKFVRKAVIEYIEKLENSIKNISTVSKDKDKELKIKEKNSEARLMNSKIRMSKALRDLIPLAHSETYKQILIAESAKILTGKELLPLPEAKEKTLTATEIGELLGISPNKVGKIAKEHNLKNENYGIWVHDKAKHCNKEITSFRYYEKVIGEIRKYI